MRTLRAIATLTFAVLAALTIACSEAATSPSRSGVTSTGQALTTDEAQTGPLATTTSLTQVILSGIAQDPEDALILARWQLDQNAPFHSINVDAMRYVEAKVGDARILFDRPRSQDMTWEVPDDVPAVIFVASGRIEVRELWERFYDHPPSHVFTTVLIVVPLSRVDRSQTRSGYTNETYDLSQFGAVHQVPLPLPPLPTPVSLAP